MYVRYKAGSSPKVETVSAQTAVYLAWVVAVRILFLMYVRYRTPPRRFAAGRTNLYNQVYSEERRSSPRRMSRNPACFSSKPLPPVLVYLLALPVYAGQEKARGSELFKSGASQERGEACPRRGRRPSAVFGPHGQEVRSIYIPFCILRTYLLR